MLVVMLAAAVALSGCTPKAAGFTSGRGDGEKPSTTGTPETALTTPTPVPPTPTPEPAAYAVDGKTIVREQGGEETVIYDVADYYSTDLELYIGTLAQEPEALYFAEYATDMGEGFDGDEESALVRADFDGGNRVMLTPLDYLAIDQIVPYGDKIYFTAYAGDQMAVCWAQRDGSGWDWLDIDGYAAAQGLEAYCIGATLHVEDGTLYGDLTLTGADSVDTEHRVRIGEDLSIARMDG